MTAFTKNTLKFLSELANNNDREWFKANKDRYLLAQENAKEFQSEVENFINKHDDVEGSKLYRIYRDVRFSKDKTPYDPRFRIGFTRRKPALRGGYYFSIQPDKAYVACGFWGPNKDDIKRIRDHISADPSEIREALADKNFIKTFDQLYGESLKNAPRGYDKEHEAVELLKLKQYLVHKEYTDKKVFCSEEFAAMVAEDYKAIRPFFDYMSYALSHDMNGVPLSNNDA